MLGSFYKERGGRPQTRTNATFHGKIVVNHINYVCICLLFVFTLFSSSSCPLLPLVVNQARCHNHAALWASADCLSMSYFRPLSVPLLLFSAFLHHYRFARTDVVIKDLFTSIIFVTIGAFHDLIYLNLSILPITLVILTTRTVIVLNSKTVTFLCYFQTKGSNQPTEQDMHCTNVGGPSNADQNDKNTRNILFKIHRIVSYVKPDGLLHPGAKARRPDLDQISSRTYPHRDS
jgi:hypothetical protein